MDDLAVFDGLYRRFHEVRQSGERTRAEVDGLTKALELRPHDRVLDLACGWGVHLAELSRRGFGRLTGVDVQESYLQKAAERLPDAGVTLLQRDARSLDFSAEFDAVYLLYNTLFTWDDNTHREVLRDVARALESGGRFLLDTTNRETVAQNGTSQSWRSPEAGLPWLLRASTFDPATGDQNFTEHFIFEDGRVETKTFKRRHYTLKELTQLFEEVGLRVANVYGSLKLDPYEVQSPRMILSATKEEPHA